jgi:metal-responsive CopG/Arc/MetJ family transcriptional regulator
MQDQQVNVRVTGDVLKRLDAERVQLRSRFERIPSRSEVIRIALRHYLGTPKRTSRSKNKQ